MVAAKLLAAKERGLRLLLRYKCLKAERVWNDLDAFETQINGLFSNYFPSPTL